MREYYLNKVNEYRTIGNEEMARYYELLIKNYDELQESVK